MNDNIKQLLHEVSYVKLAENDLDDLTDQIMDQTRKEETQYKINISGVKIA